MHKFLRASPLLVTFFLAACGGSTPPPNDGSSANSDAPGGGSGSGALADERKAFIAECNDKPGLEDFCGCSFDHLSKTTTADERKDVENPKTKKALGELPEQCGSKLPKASIQEAFVKNCAKAQAMVPFCECSFKFLDGKGLLTSGPEGVAKVEGEMKAACSNELFDLSKGAFVEACSQDQTAEVCQCTFASLEKKFGKAKLQTALEGGSAEAKTAIKAALKSCGAK